MKANKLILTSLAALFLTATQAESVRYNAFPRGNSMKIDGTSNVHNWSVESLVIGGFMELDSNFPLDPTKEPPKDLKVTPKVEVFIPVRQIKSGKSPMDTVMHEAMKAEEHPKIEYKLLEMTPKGKNETGLLFATKGTIQCSGVTRTNEFDVVISPAAAGKIKVTGTTNLKMTDFGIKPPAPKIALGAISTGDDVKLTFEWMAAPKKAE